MTHIIKKWKSFLLYAFILAWVSFTVSLTIWWYLFSQNQIDRLLQLDHAAAAELVRNQSMLFWEGATLVVCLLIGGGALAYYAFREIRQSEKLKKFFLTFSHELKTPLASLRLQAESLMDDLEDSQHEELAKRIVDDTARLSLQLENSLFLAQLNPDEMFLEEVSIRDVLDSLSPRWPALNIKTSGDEKVKADSRALESIFSNIIQNALIHGKASHIEFQVSKNERQGFVVIQALDNGNSFAGDAKKLGALFTRHYSGSGNGVGLYLCKKLAELMHGKAEYLALPEGFCVKLLLPGAPA